MADWYCRICGEGNMQDDSSCKGGARHREALAERERKLVAATMDLSSPELAKELSEAADFHAANWPEHALVMREAVRRLLE